MTTIGRTVPPSPGIPLAAGRAASGPGGAPAEDPKLRKAATQLQGVFVGELYKAMRATVPQGEGAFDGGSGEEMFTGLMDQHLATETPQAWGRGLGEAIYQRMRARVGAAAGSETGATLPGAPDPKPASLPLAAKATPMPLTTAPAMPLADPHALLHPLRDAGR